MAPQELLAAGLRVRRPVESPLELSIDDAVTFERGDYLVRAVLRYFGGARNWTAYQLHDGKHERWLEARSGGASIAWLAPAEVASADDESVVVDGATFAAQDRGAATVTVESSAGRRDGVYVQYTRYARDSGDLVVVERWPDGPRALSGRVVAREDLQLWTKPPPAE
jgi:hypothetical protein